MTIADYSKLVEQLRGRRAFLEKRLSTLRVEKTRMDSRVQAIEEAQAFIQKVAQETQKQLKFHIEDIVQLALDAVFPDEYDFRVNFEIKRGKTEARLSFLRNGIEIDPLSSAGGGVSDVCSFALRLSVWSLGGTRSVMVFDEPFKNLSKGLQPKAGEMLKKLSSRLKVQVLMSSHEESIIEIADKLFEVSLVRSGEYKKSRIRVMKEEDGEDEV